MLEATVAAHLQQPQIELRLRGDVKAFRCGPATTWMGELFQITALLQERDEARDEQLRLILARQNSAGQGSGVLCKPDSFVGTGHDQDFTRWAADFENLAALHNVPADQILRHAISHLKGPAKGRWEVCNRAATVKRVMVELTTA